MNKGKVIRTTVRLLFVVYITVLLFLVFGLDRISGSEYRYNLVLFNEIKRFVNYRDVVGYGSFLANVAGNFVIFIPFGFLVPMLSKYRFNVVFVTLLSFELSMAIEVVQLFTRLGSFDVDDLFLNTLGGSFGYIIYMLTRYVKNNRKTKDD